MDPNRIKHIGTLKKRLRRGLEQALSSAGFHFDRAWNPFPGPQSMRLDYERPGSLLSISFNDHFGQLTADIVDGDGYRTISIAVFGGKMTGQQIMARLNLEVREFVGNLSPAPSAPKLEEAP